MNYRMPRPRNLKLGTKVYTTNTPQKSEEKQPPEQTAVEAGDSNKDEEVSASEESQ